MSAVMPNESKVPASTGRAAPPEPRAATATVSLKQIADEILGLRQRTTRKITDEPWFPKAVTPMSTSRVRRWLRCEVMEALATRAPRAAKAPEPASLAAARAERRAA